MRRGGQGRGGVEKRKRWRRVKGGGWGQIRGRVRSGGGERQRAGAGEGKRWRRVKGGWVGADQGLGAGEARGAGGGAGGQVRAEGG